MSTIFETITSSLPKATEEQKQQLAALTPKEVIEGTDYEKLPLKDLVVAWNKKPSEELTSVVLHKLKPTMSSAITSYAPGHSKDLAVKAATLTLQALKTYDPARGADPTTHVFNNLKRLNRYANRRQNIIPISERAAMEYRTISTAKDDFIDTYDREPSDLELADLTGFSVKKIRKVLDGNRVISETAQINPETHNANVFESDITDDDYLDYVYRSVGPIDQKIIEWSSGMSGKPVLSNLEIAKKLHITPAAVSQRKSKLASMLSEVRGLI